MACNKPIAGLLHRYPIGSYRAVQFIAVNTLIFFFVINFLPLLYKIKKVKKRKKQNKIINPTVCWIWSSNKPNYDFKWLCVNGRQSLSFKYQHLIMILLLESKHQISKRLNVGYDGPLVAEGRGRKMTIYRRVRLVSKQADDFTFSLSESSCHSPRSSSLRKPESFRNTWTSSLWLKNEP